MTELSTSLTLLERAKQNDSLAWQKLVTLYAPLVYIRCRSHWKLSPSIAEHVGQESFSAVARGLENFERRGTGSFRAWLRTIVDNKCRDELRNKQIAVASGGTDARSIFDNAIDQQTQPLSEEQSANERSLLLRQAMKAVRDEFSERDWEIFWRVAVDEMHRQSVAEEFQVSDNVVYLAFSRVRSRLRDAYEDLLDPDLLPEMNDDNNESP